MHDLAAQYNEEHGITKTVAKRLSEQGKVPKGRPCDWCGEVVKERAWIHEACREKEQSFWLDILY